MATLKVCNTKNQQFLVLHVASFIFGGPIEHVLEQWIINKNTKFEENHMTNTVPDSMPIMRALFR